MSQDPENKELLLKISDKIDALSSNVHELDKKLAIETLTIRNELKQIAKLDRLQNEILDAHHKRSDRLEVDNRLREDALKLELQKYNAELDLRLQNLETPVSWFKNTWKVILGIGMGAGAVYAVLQILGKA